MLPSKELSTCHASSEGLDCRSEYAFMVHLANHIDTQTVNHPCQNTAASRL